MVLYILSAARKPVSTISLTYDCEARLNELCAMIEVILLDGNEAIGAGHTIFGARLSSQFPEGGEPLFPASTGSAFPSCLFQVCTLGGFYEGWLYGSQRI